MNAGSTNPICPAATLHFARTPDAFDAERNREKCDDPKCSFIASPEHRLAAAELRQIQRDMKETLFHNQ